MQFRVVTCLTGFLMKGTRAVVRLPESKKKSLGGRGIDCIFIGYAEHSKAYRFYVIEPNDFISVNTVSESRDAIFDETRFSSIPRPKDMIPSSRNEVSTLYPYCFNVEDGPKIFDEAMRSQDVAFWKEAINDEMDSIIENNTWVLTNLPFGSFVNGDLDEEVCMKQPEGFILPGNEYKQVDLTKEFLSSRFSMKDMRRLMCIRENKGIYISQSHYIEKLLKKFNYFDSTPISTPMDPSVKLMPNTGEAVFQLEYSKVIDCLMYAIKSTRLDIAYAVGKLSRFTSNPSTHLWQAIRRVLKYLKKTMNYGLSYSRFPSILEGYSSASWITNVEDHSSTSGWVFLLGGGVISWASTKQTV
ncbi:UNVERIFIED_CONTAM: Copia protein [Sesamum radiatum]|uniref:Copia protein n=1 Tax=Sesamum radiatum TaxID=300843 RepID=A0AAW2TKR6_SESRA